MCIPPHGGMHRPNANWVRSGADREREQCAKSSTVTKVFIVINTQF